MISVIFPYWQRREATDASIARMAQLYPSLDMEVVVVDDGSPEPYRVEMETPWPVRVLRLEAKKGALNPCVPLNRGVKESRGDVLVLSSPEIIHRASLLDRMLDALELVGEAGYIQAAVWCPDEARWHSHSSVAGHGDTPLPKGACLHFLVMLNRRLWDWVGGFDEDYRSGSGYEDNDFAWRLAAAGARFVCMDHLVADHPHRNPRSKWAPEGFERNRNLFVRKWLC